MGFWSTLGKIALPAVGIAAAPFTGGSSLLTTLGLGSKAATLIGAGAGIAGQLAGGAAKQRAADRGAQAEYDAARIPISNAQAMQHANLKRDAETARMRQLFGADMLSNSKPPTDPRTKLSGAGYANPETVALMRSRAMQALQSGSDVPTLQTMPEKPGGGATGMDSFLNALNIGSTALGGLQQAGLLGGSTPQIERVGSINELPSVLPPGQEEIPWWSPMRRGN